MNELLFFAHIFLLIAAILMAFRLGKSALIACLALQVVIGNLFITKQMVCFGLHVTCSDVYTIGALFSLNCVQEFYGAIAAKKAIWTAFFILFLFIAFSQMHLRYIPSPYDTMQDIFTALLTSSPRIMIVSFAVGIFSERLDVLIYGFLKKKLPEKGLIFRFGISSLIAQLIDTLLFTFLALYGLFHSMTHIICMSYLIKVIIIFCIFPFIQFAKRFYRGPVHI